MCSSDLNRKGKSTPMQFVTSGRHPYFILVDNRIFYSACMALGMKSRITKLKLLRLRTACKTASFSMVGKLRVNLYFTHHFTTVVEIQTFPWWGNQKRNLYYTPPNKFAPVKHKNSSMVETVKVKYTFKHLLVNCSVPSRSRFEKGLSNGILRVIEGNLLLGKKSIVHINILKHSCIDSQY